MAPLMEPLNPAPAPEKPLRLLNLERELAGEGSLSPQEALEKYDSVLRALAERLKHSVDAGLTPDDFAKCQNMDSAVTTARKILRLTISK